MHKIQRKEIRTDEDKQGNSPNPALSLYFVGQFIQQFRRNVNNATTAIAASNMLDEEATAALLCILDSNASATYVALEHQRSMQTEDERANESEDLVSSGCEGLAVEPLNLKNAIPKSINPFVFSYPFVIPPFRDSSLAECSETLASICAVALYNCALSRHTKAFLAKDEERTELLEQAEGLYQQSLVLLDNINTLSAEGSLIQVYLACCNNMAEVHAALENTQQAKEFQDTLRQSLWAVPPALDSPVYNHFVTAVQCYGIDPIPMQDNPLMMECDD